MKWSRDEPYSQTDICKEQHEGDTREDDPHWIDHHKTRDQNAEDDGDTLYTRWDQVDLFDAPGAVEISVFLQPSLHLAADIGCALEEHIGENSDVEVPVPEYSLQHAFSDLGAVLGSLALHTGNGELAFFVR